MGTGLLTVVQSSSLLIDSDHSLDLKYKTASNKKELSGLCWCIYRMAWGLFLAVYFQEVDGVCSNILSNYLILIYKWVWVSDGSSVFFAILCQC